MRVVKNRRSRNNVPDNDTITPAAGVHTLHIPPRSISSYRAPNYVAVYDENRRRKGNGERIDEGMPIAAR